MRRPAQVAGLVLAALLLGLFIALPLCHQLFHAGAGESETCPVRLLESSLVLLFGAPVSLLLLLPAARLRVAVLWSVPLALFCCAFYCTNRAPPLS